jgi:hypothetical protein
MSKPVCACIYSYLAITFWVRRSQFSGETTSGRVSSWQAMPRRSSTRERGSRGSLWWHAPAGYFQNFPGSKQPVTSSRNLPAFLGWNIQLLICTNTASSAEGGFRVKPSHHLSVLTTGIYIHHGLLLMSEKQTYKIKT